MSAQYKTFESMKGLPDILFPSLLENEFDEVHSNGIPKRHWFQMQVKVKEIIVGTGIT